VETIHAAASDASMTEEDRHAGVDPVKLYLTAAGEAPLLNAEQEIELAKKIEAGDASAREQMICCNLRLVVKLAKRYRYTQSLTFLDLIQEGNIGLMTAVNKYDYRVGCRFSTFAIWWIRQAISRSVYDADRTIRLPVHVGELVRKVSQAKNRLEQEEGFIPDTDQLAEMLKLRKDTVELSLRIAHHTISLESPLTGDETSVLGDFIEDRDSISTEEHAMGVSMRHVLDQQLASLTQRERRILELRFGINNERTYTLEEVGSMYHLTRERIRQIERGALRKLSRPNRRKYLEDFIK
jgi:RNA polymerase primary sigma factor